MSLLGLHLKHLLKARIKQECLGLLWAAKLKWGLPLLSQTKLFAHKEMIHSLFFFFLDQKVFFFFLKSNNPGYILNEGILTVGSL